MIYPPPVNLAKSVFSAGVFHIFGLGGGDATILPIEEVGPAIVFEAAFDGGQTIGARFRSSAPRSFEAAFEDLLAGAFTMPDPAGNSRVRQRSVRMRSLLVSK